MARTYTQTPDTLQPQLDRIQRLALLVGGAALLLSVVTAFVSGGTQFFQSYLYAFIFWIAPALGSLAILMLQHLTGGAWGATIRRLLEAGAMTIPLMGLLFLPILLIGLQDLYPWSRPGADANALIAAKQIYLNVPFFAVRAVLYFAIWSGLALALNRWSLLLDQTNDPALALRMERLSGAGIVLYVLTMTFAAVDWGMSLEPEWFSAMYGVIYMVGQGLTTLAFMAILMHLLRNRQPFAKAALPGRFQDIGGLMFAFIVLWTYTSFAQYLIIWSGNIAETTPYYAHRSSGGWQYIAIALMIFQFFVPFMILLSRKVKRNSLNLALIAVFIIFMRLLDLFWTIKPSFYPEGFQIHLLDIVLLIALGGIWIGAFLWALKRKPLLPLNVPALAQKAHGH